MIGMTNIINRPLGNLSKLSGNYQYCLSELQISVLFFMLLSFQQVVLHLNIVHHLNMVHYIIMVLFHNLDHHRPQQPFILARAVGVPVSLCSGGQLATTLVATINIIIFFHFPFFFSVTSFSHRRSAWIEKLL